MARKLGPNLFGIFSNVLAISLIFSLIAGFGVSKTWLKLFGTEGWGGVRWIKPSLRVVLITLLCVILIVLLLTTFDFNDSTTKELLLLMIFHIIGYSAIELVSSKLQLEENYYQLALWQLLPNLSRLIIIASGYYLFRISYSIRDIGLIYVFVGLVFTFLGINQIIKMSKGEFSLKGHDINKKSTLSAPTIKNVFLEVWPFGLGGVFAFIYVQSDIIIVKYLAGDEQAGFYNASFIILSIIYTFPSILYQKFLMPKFHRWANHERDKFYRVYSKGNRLMLFCGIIMLFLVILLSNFFIPIIFGENYQESIGLINILAITLPFQLVAFSVASTLVTKDNMIRKVRYMGLVAILNIILNLYLVPKYQAKGAAIATVISNAILLGIYFYAARRYVFKDKNSTYDFQ
ncbi:MAG: oligosaccharide flippase family protein [Flavobacteriaceae bacterium]|nr:oligosaccharide flippase family protein [Flavobacteriaceae bacterium]